MIDIESLKHEIVERLKPLEPEKIILFGSYAYGTPTENSDIDLYVVTKDEFIPQDFAEKSKIYLNVAHCIEDIMGEVPTDLIVHTKGMNKKFIGLNSSFARELMNKGVRLYSS